jgi:hypothetical protein
VVSPVSVPCARWSRTKSSRLVKMVTPSSLDFDSMIQHDQIEG